MRRNQYIMDSDRKSKNFAKSLKQILHYCRPFWVPVGIALLCAMGGTILTLLGPDRLSDMTDLIGEGILGDLDMEAIMSIGFTLIAFYAASFLLSLCQGWIMAYVTQKLSKNLRTDISGKINRLPMWFYNRTSTGDILSRVTNDVDTIAQSMNQNIGTMVSAATLLIGSLIMMLTTNVILTVTAVLASLTGFVLMFVIMGHSQGYFTRQQKHLGELNGHIEEIYAGHTVVKAYNGEKAAQAMQSAAAAGERIFEFLGAEEMPDESGKTKKLGKAQGYVEFRHVRFGYEDSDHVIIKDFSAEAKPGQKIAIVGPTGAGKTTIVNLLMRFHEIQAGEIRIDGVPTGELTRENVHDQFCMVLQDTWLFEGTVRENLVYCMQNVSDETMQNACRAVGLDHFIRTLPHGYDTILNDQVNLSQGQKQQLTIARAMIADKPMLILDEATSSVDTRTELVIQSAMDELMKNRTSFVIAHRLSTIKNADLILVLKDGDIIESGTHEELLAKGGFYAELYNSQFEKAS